MSLINYMKTAMNKQYSYPRVAAIQINVHPVGENPTNLPSLFMLGPHMTLDRTYLMRSTYSNLSQSHQQWWIEPLVLRRRAPNTPHNTTADRSAGPYPISLLEETIEAVWVNPPSIDGMLLGLLSPYTSMWSIHSILGHGGQAISP
jgi:hypothetical protein